MTTVIVSGASGKMGTEAVKAIEEAEGLICVGKAGREDDLFQLIKETKAEVVVDLTHPSVARKNAEAILKAGAHAVIGTTGFSEKELEELDQLAKEKGKALFIFPNFAIGAVLMMKAAKEAASYFDRVEIIEMHHPKKADAPSGTAIKTAHLIHEGNPKINDEKLSEKEEVLGARGGSVKNIPIHSIRIPGVVADQEVVFGGLDQTYIISHKTLSRLAFMPGIILSIRKTKEHVGLRYGLESIL